MEGQLVVASAQSKQYRVAAQSVLLIYSGKWSLQLWAAFQIQRDRLKNMQGDTMVKFLCAVPKVLSESEDDKLEPPSPIDSSKELGHVGCVE